MLLLQGAEFPPLVGELRFHKLQIVAKKKKKSEHWLPLREDEKLGITEEYTGDIRE